MFTVAILAVARPAPAAQPRSASLQSGGGPAGASGQDLTQLGQI